jgi:hypothetical protein
LHESIKPTYANSYSLLSNLLGSMARQPDIWKPY